MDCSAQRLLFVDDDASIRRAFQRVMTRQGYRVDLACDGAEGLRMAQAQPYPIIVTDLRMPKMDGMTLIREVCRSGRGTQFIILSGLPQLDVPQGHGELPIVSILEKPWNDEELMAAVDRASTKSFEATTFEVTRTRVLLVEDNPGDALLVTDHLDDGAIYDITTVERLQDALDLLRDTPFDVVVTDLSLPDARGLDTVIRLQKAAPDSAVIVLSGMDDQRLALQAVKAGAQDYLFKRLDDLHALHRCIRYACERKAAERRLTRLACFDHLTGLANRAHFRDQLAQSLARAARNKNELAVMFLDLDRFKAINDELGHEAGDQLLQRVAGRLERCVREYDTVARLGGDEFAILLDDVRDSDESRSIAERIVASFREPIALDKCNVSITTSLGVATFPDAGEGVDSLLKAADGAMYRAKARGRNQFTFAIDGAGHKRPVSTSDLRQALDDHRFVLHYQPQWNLRTGKLVGAEALLRMRMPNGDLLPPADFLSVLEETNLITEVGEWVLNAACRAATRWVGTHPGFCVAVNVSARQFEAGDIIDVVAAALRSSGLPARCLELEITESVLMRDTVATNSALAGLKGLGVRIAIDDFGTGYSSLAYLDRFDVDVLKIDRSFIRSVTTSRSSRSIASAIIALGQNLGLTVVAEGIETEAQLDVLREERCDSAQGYLLGRPQAVTSRGRPRMASRMRLATAEATAEAAQEHVVPYDATLSA